MPDLSALDNHTPTANDPFLGRRNTDNELVAFPTANIPVGAPFGGAGIADQILLQEGYEITSLTRDADGVPVSGVVVWYDGSAGVLTVTDTHSTHLTVDGYTVTHATSGKTVTQPAVTRDSTGRITTIPQKTVS